MSTITVVESFDTQMLDYSIDLDVPMNASSETWHIHTPMEADSPHLRPQSTTVEVEMEPFDNAGEEYEMGDDHYYVHTTEVLDVEVYDVSQAPTPRLVPEIELPLAHLAPATPPVFAQPGGALPPLPSVGHTLLPENTSEPPVIYQPPYVEVHAAPQDSIFRHEPKSSATNYYQPIELPSWEAVPGSEEPATVTEAYTVADVAAHPAETSESGHQEDPGSHTEVAHPSPEPDDGARQDQDEADQEEQTDPHEISEGIYIDPPPAVLLSLPGSTLEERLFSLFNQPQASSRATSPSQQDRAPSLTLFLHHRPTLYYEPLSHLFQALRQDVEFAARVHDLEEGELILDAYDLHLAIPEVCALPY